MKTRLCYLPFVLFWLVLPATAQVSGSGATDYIAKWTSSTALGKSIIFQTNGRIGIGTTSPTAILNVRGGIAQAGINAPPALDVTGGTGQSLNFGGGAGGFINLTGGTGGGARVNSGGAGGSVVITGGKGGPGPGGGSGGSITLQPGAGGLGTNSSGPRGKVILAPAFGRVGIGTSTPSATLDVAAGHTTLADQWTTRSSRRFKTNIQPLVGALQKVEHLQGVSYESRAEGKHEIGVIAEDVARVVPEVVSSDPTTHQIQGVDYSKFSVLLIEAVKSQQAELRLQRSEIQQLKTQIHQLASKSVR